MLRGASLDVPADGVVGILGPNGSGKTTLLRVLAGTLRPSSGRVTLDGVDLSRLSRSMMARRMAVVPQETHLAFDFTVLEVVLMGRYPHLGTFEVEGPRDFALARRALEATGTGAFEDRLFATLSGGEKQRVIIAAALAQISSENRGQAVNRSSAESRSDKQRIDDSRPDPGILLLDEPTAALDLAYQLEVASLLRDLQRRTPIAIVISTHDLNFAAGLCKTLVLLKDGRILASGATGDVLTAGNIRTLYGIEADVQPHAGAGHLVVVAGRPERARDGLVTIRRRIAVTTTGFGLVAVAAVTLAPLVGSTAINLRRAFDWSVPFADNVDAQIFFVARLPRTLAGALVGAALATAGVVFQGLLRNPLATPFTLGVSSGAALGAMLAITFNWTLGVGGISAVSVAGFVGAACAVTIVYALARAHRRGLSTDVLLLAGVTLNAFFSALILCVQYFADFADAYRTLRWLMGDLDVSSYQPIVTSLPLLLAAFAVFAWLARPLNLLSLGADSAETRGIDVTSAQRRAFFSASLATGAAVSVGGPVGFIGIIVPHLVRLIVGSDHRVVLPASALFGAAFLVGCDVLARTLIAPVEIPVGVITALIGGPFFLWLLVRKA